MPRSTAKRRKEGANAPDTIDTVAFVSLGCPKNLVDSEKMLGLLAEEGLAIIAHDPDEDERADAIVINTCGFLEAAKEESLSVIDEALRAKREGRTRRVVVAGCLVQRHRAKLLEWAPDIDALIGVFDRDKIVEAVRGVRPGRATLADSSDRPNYWVSANALTAAAGRGIDTVGLTVQGKDGRGIGYFEDDSARLRITPRHYAYLRMSEGCNQRCAFCTIPSIRGKMRSKPLERLAAEARELIADGVFELNLIGQDTTSYGDDIGVGFDKSPDGRDVFSRGGLPSALKAACGAFEHGQRGWVRLMYAYPSNFADEYIDAIAELSIGNGGNLVPYIDIPLQHASDRVLGLMRRNVTAAHQRELMRKLRERVPGIAIRTTFISGFPGETEDDHRRLVDFVEEVGFEAMGVFEYSYEDGTPAATLEDDPALAVSPEDKARRRDELMQLQQRIAFGKAATLASQFDEARPKASRACFDVLIDSRSRTDATPTSGVSSGGGLYVGRTYFQAPSIDAVTFVHSEADLSPGEVVRCVVVASDGYDLISRPIDELDKKRSLPILR